jgi:hypothetical protein
MMQKPLPTIDGTMLTEVVRKEQNSPDFELIDWTVSTLSNRGGNDAASVLLVSGRGRDKAGTRPWEVALKITALPSEEIPPYSLFNARRELLAYGSGMLESLPGPILAARCYGVIEQAGAVWLWTEVLTDVTSGSWTLPDLIFAADQLGRFNANCALAGSSPTEPWLARAHAEQWITIFNSSSALENPHVQEAFPAALWARLERLWADRTDFLAVLDRLPQTFSHFDYKCDNLFLRHRADGQREVVAVDWAVCGVGALGGDLVSLVGASTWQFNWEPKRISDLDIAAFAAYVQGLRVVGWQGDEAHIRLAYTAWLATHFGLITPACIGWAIDRATEYDSQRLFRRSPNELLEGWLRVCAYALDCADEARLLMARLNLS